MKKLSLGIAVAALGFVAGPVSAADMPVKAPPIAIPANAAQKRVPWPVGVVRDQSCLSRMS